ncbi:MAG: guanylate kinase [Clostridia bacterium]|nr:guanylate kinase [Clostridia bacterium]
MTGRDHGLVFVVSGPSGSGKGTVIGELGKIYSKTDVAVSATSRKPREGEKEGVNYFYKTRKQFEKLLREGEILEHTEYNGNYYGTLKSEVKRITDEGNDVILEIEVDGCSQVKKLLGDACVTVMLTAPSREELERRLRNRGTETEEEIQKRLERALFEVSRTPYYDYLLINETGRADECAGDLLAVIRAEHLRTVRSREVYEEGYGPADIG